MEMPITKLLEFSPQRMAEVLLLHKTRRLALVEVEGALIASDPRFQSLADDVATMPAFSGHEAVFFWADNVTGALFIAAVHSSVRGPALGGAREADYGTTLAAVHDVLRLSSGMTRKAAMAGIAFGGGKAVIARLPGRDYSDPLLRTSLYEAFGRAIASLGGYYITAEDMGNSVEDMAHVLRRNRFTACLPRVVGGSGDPSPHTAEGVIEGMRACLEHLVGTADLRGVTVAIQGLGHVGLPLAQRLHAHGARLLVADVNADRVAGAIASCPGAVSVPPDHILRAECDILAPCAGGDVLDEQAIDALRCRILCGAANNPLANEVEGARRLMQRGVLYPVDFNVNRGGVVNAGDEILGANAASMTRKVQAVYDDTLAILRAAAARHTTPLEIAYEIAHRRALVPNPLVGHIGAQRAARFLPAAVPATLFHAA